MQTFLQARIQAHDRGPKTSRPLAQTLSWEVTQVVISKEVQQGNLPRPPEAWLTGWLLVPGGVRAQQQWQWLPHSSVLHPDLDLLPNNAALCGSLGLEKSVSSLRTFEYFPFLLKTAKVGF